MVYLDDVRYILNFVLADYYNYLDDDLINSIVDEVVLRLEKDDFTSDDVSPPVERPMIYKDFKKY